MTLSVAAEPIPLVVDADGVARVGGTRVTLDTIIRAFRRGESAEWIAESYSALDLADIYAVITYYLRHEDDVQRYLGQRQRRVDDAHELIEATADRQALRERLRAHRDERSRFGR